MPKGEGDWGLSETASLSSVNSDNEFGFDEFINFTLRKVPRMG